MTLLSNITLAKIMFQKKKTMSRNQFQIGHKTLNPENVMY